MNYHTFTLNEDILIQDVVSKHKLKCINNSKCKFCNKIKENLYNNLYPKKKKLDEINLNIEILCTFLYKYIVKGKEISEVVLSAEYRTYLYLIDLYICFLSKKNNLLKIVIKYYRIKKYIQLVKEKNNSSLRSRSNHFLNFFNLNLELLYYKITTILVSLNSETQKFSYLIQIDTICRHISDFLSQTKKFLELNIKTPSEVFLLAEKYSHLKKKIDLTFFDAKEQSNNYQSLLCQYTLEQIYHEDIRKNNSVSDKILSLDEYLELRYKEDSIILILYDIQKETLWLRICGKAFADSKDKNFDKLFPSFLRKEGTSRMFHTLLSGKTNVLTYYYSDAKIYSIEQIKMKLWIIPSFDHEKHNLIYVMCNYRIESQNIAVFKKIKSKEGVIKILVALSETLLHFFGFKANTLEESLENRNYILDSDIFDTSSHFLDYQSFKANVKTRFNITPGVQFKSKKQLIFDLHETIDNIYEIYFAREFIKETRLEKGSNFESNLKNPTISDKQNSLLGMSFHTVHTVMSSSVNTNSNGTVFRVQIKNIKEEKDDHFRHFYWYSYYILMCNILNIIVIGIFLVIELLNNISLMYIFIGVTNYNFFQTNFYHTGLSIFSLTCNADKIEDTTCINNFIYYSEYFVEKNGLTENEYIHTYISREVSLKTNLVIETLEKWKRYKQSINSKELNELLSEDFSFTTVEEKDSQLDVVDIYLSLNDSVKRLVSLLNLLSALDEYLVSPVYTFSIIDAKSIDLSNLIKNKKPLQNGMYLNEAQKYYYMVALNYQKYIKKLLKLGNILYNYYEDKVSFTRVQLMIFIIIFFALQIVIFIISTKFILKFKELHIDYYKLIYQKSTETEFLNYFNQKLECLEDMMYFYKVNPNQIYHKIRKLTQEEEKRNSELAKKDKLGEDNTLLPQLKENNIDSVKINSIYNTIVVKFYLLQLFPVLFCYCLICIIIYIVTNDRIKELSSMNKYSQYIYDSSNNMYINTCLVQLMSLTNQSDIELYNYLEDKTDGIIGYVRHQTQLTLDIIEELIKMQKYSSIYNEFKKLVDINCDILFEQLNDNLIETLIETWPESDYRKLLKVFCHSFRSISVYKDDKLAMIDITYQTAHLMTMFTGREYSDFTKINNNNKLYLLYADLLLIIRPIRRFLYSYLEHNIIKKIIKKFNVFIIVFIVFNFITQLAVLLFIQFVIVNSVLSRGKEIMCVAKSFECF